MLRERERTLEGELKELKAKEQPLRQQLDEKTRKNTRYSALRSITALNRNTALLDAEMILPFDEEPSSLLLPPRLRRAAKVYDLTLLYMYGRC